MAKTMTKAEKAAWKRKMDAAKAAKAAGGAKRKSKKAKAKGAKAKGAKGANCACKGGAAPALAKRVKAVESTLKGHTTALKGLRTDVNAHTELFRHIAQNSRGLFSNNGRALEAANTRH